MLSSLLRKRPKMRTINETFTGEEFQKLQTKKGTKSWHDFIMESANLEKM
jgi:hypothetical protein